MMSIIRNNNNGYDIALKHYGKVVQKELFPLGRPVELRSLVEQTCETTALMRHSIDKE